MPWLSLEGRGRFETQSLRASQAGGLFGLHGRQQILRAHHCSDGKARPLHIRDIAGRILGTAVKHRLSRLSCQKTRKSFSGHLSQSFSKRRAEQRLSPLDPGRRRKITYSIEAKNISQCLRTSHYLPAAPQRLQRQLISFQRASGQKLLRLLIVVEAAQMQSSSKDGTCSQQLEVSVANKDGNNAHSAFMELQKAGQNGRPTAGTCNGLLQCESPYEGLPKYDTSPDCSRIEMPRNKCLRLPSIVRFRVMY